MTEIICIIDRSGSMASIRSDAVGGFNAFLEDQQGQPGEARLTLVLFNHEYRRVHDAVPIADVQPFDKETYVPAGTTALLDAIGRAIDDVRARLADTPEGERPAKVLVCILTDGMENASSDYTRDRIREMIGVQQKEHGWEFAFLAANQDAFAEAGRLGIRPEDAVAYEADAEGIRAAYASISERTSLTRRR